jgi:hypothetical protein
LYKSKATKKWKNPLNNNIPQIKTATKDLTFLTVNKYKLIPTKRKLAML